VFAHLQYGLFAVYSFTSVNCNVLINEARKGVGMGVVTWLSSFWASRHDTCVISQYYVSV